MTTLPLELVWEIVQNTWHSPLSLSERKLFLSSGLLVNTQLAVMFLEISSADVHILDRPFMDYYFRLLQGNSVLLQLGRPRRKLLSDLGRRLTIYITNADLPSTPPGKPDAENLLSDFFKTLKVIDGLPHLRTIKVRFQNVSCEDVFQHDRFIDFPPQVECLELEYSYTSLIPRWMIPMPHFLASGSNPSWTLPSIRHLRVIGGFDDLMKMVFVCPKIELLEMGACMYWDRKSRRDVRDESLIRTLFIRGLPSQYADSLPTQIEGQPLQKMFVFTENPTKGDDGSLTYFWWISHDFSQGDVTDYENVQYVSCSEGEGPKV